MALGTRASLQSGISSGVVQKSWALIALCLVVGLGAALRLQDLSHRTLTHIEVYVPGIDLPPGLSQPEPRHTLRDTLIGLVHLDKEPQPPGYYLLMFAWTKAFGADIRMLRLPSALFGVGSVLLLYVLGALEYDRWVGLLAAGMLALNGHQIYWSQLAGPYLMAEFFAVLATALLLLAMRSAARTQAYQVLYVVAVLAGLGTNQFFWMVFFVHVIWVALHALGSKASSPPGMLRWQLLAAGLASPLIGLAFFQSRRVSPLDPNALRNLGNYLSFGFSFEPDFAAVPPQVIPAAAALVVLVLGSVLLAAGLLVRSFRSDHGTWPSAGPSSWLFVAAAVLTVAAGLRLTRFTFGTDPDRNQAITLSLLPALLPLGDYVLRRHWKRLASVGRPLGSLLWRLGGRQSISVWGAVLPVAVLVLVSPALPLFDSRTALLFVPFLLVLLAAGLVYLVRTNKYWAGLLPAVALIHSLSPVYFHGVTVEQPTAYKGLAEQWLPQIRPEDVIVVRANWETTPIFYYVPWRVYRLVEQNQAPKVMADNPGARVWVVLPAGLQSSPAVEQALGDYQLDHSVEARNISATLYVPRPAEPGDEAAAEGATDAGQTDASPGGDTSTNGPSAGTITTHPMAFSTYLGGGGEDTIRDVTTDSLGNIYVTGGTAAIGFPQTTTVGPGGWLDVFVTKYDPAGQLVWSTVVGGPNYDRTYGIELDAQGNVYVTGRAGPGFPTTAGAFQPAFNGFATGPAYGSQNAFVAKLSPAGSLLWASYIGPYEFMRDLDVEPNGTIFVVGPRVPRETGTPPPAAWFANAYQATPNTGEDLVTLKIATDGSHVIWATYLGGPGNDGIGPAVRVDSSGQPVIVTTTSSPHLPTTPGAYQPDLGGQLDFFLVRFNSSGSDLVSATYLGGSLEESLETHSLALDSQGNAYITGYVNSNDFPTTPGSYQPTIGGGYDVPIALISADGTQLLASTYLGGGGGEGAQSIVVDAQGRVNVFGTTSSANFPHSTDAYQPNAGGGEDFFVAILSPDLSTLEYGTFLGGAKDDEGRAGRVDGASNVIVVGMTQSSNWPTQNASDPTYASGWDGALAKFGQAPVVAPPDCSSPGTYCRYAPLIRR